MDEGYRRAVSLLPDRLAERLYAVEETLSGRVQEIRLRAGRPVTLSTAEGECRLPAAAGRPGGNDLLTAAVLEECFLRLCEYSVHAHQEELRRGYVTAVNGCRVGIAGTAVTENGRIASVRGITSLCLRVARRHDGCAAALADRLARPGGLASSLLCGEPSSGKSSLLRDLAARLARSLRVAVVDERGELSGPEGLPDCDVLRGYPKAEGIQQAVRCLAPDVIVFDELGTREEVSAVLEGLNAGVAAVASAHCRDEATFLRRPQLKAAAESGAFEQAVFLHGRRRPGQIDRIVRMEDMEDTERVGRPESVTSEPAKESFSSYICAKGAWSQSWSSS